MSQSIRSNRFQKQQDKQIRCITMKIFPKKKRRPSLLAPLTFLTVIDHKQKKPYQYIIDLGMDLGRILHAGQKYKYHHPIYSGDVITKRGKISNIYEKNNGDLQFVEFKSYYTNQRDIMVAESLAIIAYRNNI